MGKTADTFYLTHFPKIAIDPSVKRPGLQYVYAVGIFATVGGFIFGYDIGVISGILVMKPFMDQFNPTTFDSSWIVAFFQLGCFFGALAQAPIADKLGRKKAVIIGALVFLVGGTIQTAAVNIPMLYIGRVIAGFSVGQLSMIVPLYQAELAPAYMRGRLVAMQQFIIVLGIAVAFWINYGTNFITNDWSWRAPLIVQILAALILSIGMLPMPYSPRWLMSVGREKEALINLAKVRSLPVDNSYVIQEFAEIKLAFEVERELGEATYAELFSPGLRKRLLIGCAIQAFQQTSGINAISYYAPTIFAQVGNSDTTKQLLLTGFDGIVEVLFTIPAVLYLDRLGRRYMLLLGGSIMCVMQVMLAILIARFGAYGGQGFKDNPAAGAFGILGVYAYVAGFAFSWGPVAWLMNSEIYPLRARAKAISISTASDWIFNFAVALIVPVMTKNTGYGTYVLFTITCFIMVAFTYLFVPETKGLTLEEMDKAFGGKPLATSEAEKELEIRLNRQKEAGEIDSVEYKNSLVENVLHNEKV